VEGTGRDEKDVVGLHRPMFGADGCSFDQREKVALNAFAADICPACVRTGADLVDFIEEDDAVFLHGLHCRGTDGLIVEELVGLLPDQHLITLRNGHPLAVGAATESLEQILQALHLLFHAGHAEPHRHRRDILHVDFNHRIVKLTAFQLGAEHVAGLLTRVFAGDGVDHPIFSGFLGLCLYIVAHLHPGIIDSNIDKIAHDGIYVPANIANFGELRRLDLEEGRFRELGEAAANLGLADPGWSDHQDVLGVDLVAKVVAQPFPPPAIAQGHGNGALGFLLADDEAVKFGDNLAGGEVGHSVDP
jgi:hypothetical protein